MKSSRLLSAAVLGGLGLLLAFGCAKRQNVAAEEPAGEMEEASASPTPVAALPKPVPTPMHNSYIVRKHDTLWGIAGDAGILGDKFRWPLLFKANRDQIIDPDLIEPSQDLTWKDNYSTSEIAEASTKAKETPPYVPHSVVRKQLPLKY